MTNLILAASKLDDWMQIVILILVFGGSVFSAIAKKLIVFFRERKAKRQLSSARPLVQPVKQTQVRPVSRPTLPVAEAMPEARTATRPQTPPTARRGPIKPVVPRHAAEASRPAPPPRHAVPQPPPQRRTATPSPPRHVRTERPTKSVRRSRPVASVAAHVQAHITREKSRLENEGAQVDAVVDQHVGGLQRRMAKRDDAIDLSSVGTGFGALSVYDLRKAIVLNEILNPPLALRDEPNGW